MSENSNFIKTIINQDLVSGKHDEIITRYPPEPNGYMHIGHAFSFLYQYHLAHDVGGKTFLRFDDTNPAGESEEYAESIKRDITWLGLDWEELHYASDYFEMMFNLAVGLIKKGLAYIDDSTEEEIRTMRGSLTTPGTPSTYRNRSVEDNLSLFQQMRSGAFKEGERVLRAKIDLSSSNMNMRDPILYRIMYMKHFRTGNAWCIYPMYDYAHPIEDAIEGITHSLCSIEFENHRPLYDWVVANTDVIHTPRQIEFARFNLTNTVMSKRHLKRLVEEGLVNGWDDPRLPTVAGLRRRGFTKESIWNFALAIGLSKQGGTTDYAMLEEYLRQDLKDKARRPMAVIEPLLVTITNYPQNEYELVEGEYNADNEALGHRTLKFSRKLYIEQSDFLEDKPNKKWKRLSVGLEVRLRHAYFIHCHDVVKDERGQVIELLCTYDEATKSGTDFEERKPNGTIHWVNHDALPAEFRLYDVLLHEGDAPAEERFNEASLVTKFGYVEESILGLTEDTHYQFIRNGFFMVDVDTDLAEERYVFNRIVSLKSSF
jgi:glutaminyl-tRNA synthetase